MKSTTCCLRTEPCSKAWTGLGARAFSNSADRAQKVYLHAMWLSNPIFWKKKNPKKTTTKQKKKKNKYELFVCRILVIACITHSSQRNQEMLNPIFLKKKKKKKKNKTKSRLLNVSQNMLGVNTLHFIVSLGVNYYISGAWCLLSKLITNHAIIVPESLKEDKS